MNKADLNITYSKGAEINPDMFGLFFEDINYSLDGGINAQMLENPNFEFFRAIGGDFDHYSAVKDCLYGWISYPANENGAVLDIITDNTLSVNNPHHLSFTASDKALSIANKAYDGLNLVKDKEYKFSCYLKSLSYSSNVYINILNSKEEPIIHSLVTSSVNDEWAQYDITFISPIDINDAIFTLGIDSPDTIYLDFLSLIPSDAIYGIFRRDLLDMLKAMNPGFLRFPGGCIVEGSNLDNRYRWKQSIGELINRIPNWNRWAVHDIPKGLFAEGPYSHYNQSLQIGYYEYFLLCEYIGAKPLPVQNVGLSCQFQSTGIVPIASDDFNEYIQDILDLIEFANGPVDSTWGSLRAKFGHTEPFKLEMIGIGNEQWQTEKVDFFERYELFEKQIHAVYPDIKLISSAGPDVTSELCTRAWDFYKKHKQQADFTYAVDEHYYRPIDWMLDNDHFYDKYERDIKVFAGEYATHINPARNKYECNSLEAAIGEAAFLTGVERNSDVVILCSYAPLFARIGYAQWTPDLIWFNNNTCYATPSYYVQQMYSCNRGNYNISSSFTNSKDELIKRLYKNVSYDAVTNDLILKLVNANENDVNISINLSDDYSYEKTSHCITLASDVRTDYNCIDNPDKVIPSKSIINVDDTFIMKPYSFSIIRIHLAHPHTL